MEDMTVVFFYVDETGSGRKRLGRKRFGGWRWSRGWQYKVYCEKKEMGDGSLKIVCVGLPRLETDKEWTNISLQQYLRGLPVPPEGKYVYYAPDRKAEQLMGRGREPIGVAWILTFIEYYCLSFDGMVLIQDREMEAEELIRHYAGELPYLGVVRDFMTDWEEVEESLSMEYGLTLDLQKKFELLHIKGERLLTVVGTGAEIPDPERLRAGSVILSTEGRRTEKDRRVFDEKKIINVDMERFLKDTVLDTVRKIKYNSTR